VCQAATALVDKLRALELPGNKMTVEAIKTKKKILEIELAEVRTNFDFSETVSPSQIAAVSTRVFYGIFTATCRLQVEQSSSLLSCGADGSIWNYGDGSGAKAPVGSTRLLT